MARFSVSTYKPPSRTESLLKNFDMKLIGLDILVAAELDLHGGSFGR
jgi:hypothetical protein